MLHRRLLISIHFVIALATVGSIPAAATAPAPERQLFDLLNQEREKAGLVTLQWDPQLAAAAQTHARLLAEQHQLSHQLPGEPELGERLAVSGARFTQSAENIALADAADDAHLGFMYSAGHRANILSGDYNGVGIGVATYKGRFYVAEDFAWLVPAYTEEQFQSQLVAAFNSARKLRKSPLIEAHFDNRLRAQACSTDGALSVATGLSGASELVAFTLSQPERPPEEILKRSNAARRVDLGVCFRPGPKYGAANFWVVAAFY